LALKKESVLLYVSAANLVDLAAKPAGLGVLPLDVKLLTGVFINVSSGDSLVWLGLLETLPLLDILGLLDMLDLVLRDNLSNEFLIDSII
tara:strand:- start:1592 stop:1861 length:270 start_codon:yes stop_codon:yes gene_type:complete